MVVSHIGKQSTPRYGALAVAAHANVPGIRARICGARRTVLLVHAVVPAAGLYIEVGTVWRAHFALVKHAVGAMPAVCAHVFALALFATRHNAVAALRDERGELLIVADVVKRVLDGSADLGLPILCVELDDPVVKAVTVILLPCDVILIARVSIHRIE